MLQTNKITNLQGSATVMGPAISLVFNPYPANVENRVSS
jgi:hypothetical protein